MILHSEEGYTRDLDEREVGNEIHVYYYGVGFQLEAWECRGVHKYRTMDYCRITPGTMLVFDLENLWMTTRPPSGTNPCGEIGLV